MGFERELDVHSIKACDHRWNVEQDGQRCQEFDGFVQVISENNLVGVSERPNTFQADAAEVF